MSNYQNRNTESLFKNTDLLMSQEVNVLTWSPGKVEENTPPTEVHLLCTVFKYAQMAFVVRLKSRKLCAELIAALQSHMDEVWPEGRVE